MRSCRFSLYIRTHHTNLYTLENGISLGGFPFAINQMVPLDASLSTVTSPLDTCSNLQRELSHMKI